MNQQEKTKLINDIEALIKISDNLAMSFYFKAKELRDKYQKEIREYNEFIRLIEGKTLDIKFEMEYLDSDWTVSVPGFPDFDTGTIPVEIIWHITNNASSTGIIKMIKDFKTGDGRKFNIHYEKTSEHIISGTITENIENFAPYTELQDISTSGARAKMKAIYELFMFLKDNDEFCNWMLSQFYNNWKPLFETGCIQPMEKS
jgi:hypothetical protein